MTLDPERYWNERAAEYDSLYNSAWCQRENDLVRSRLATLPLPQNPIVLDLACGTGLGLRLLGNTHGALTYFGVDLSSQMIAAFDVGEAQPADLRLEVQDIATYDWPFSYGPDLIMATFGGISFCR